MVVKDLLRYRLFNHQLTGTAFSRPVELVACQAEQRAVAKAAERYGKFLSLPVTVS